MLDNFVDLKKEGKRALVSFCIANPLAIRVVLKGQLGKKEFPALFEATSNQVNHKGGYTGMRPSDYKDMIYKIASKLGFPTEKIIFGGDHLGPLPFSDLPADDAMQEAEEMVKEYVLAGFQKIHIDTSMALGGESHPSKEVIASRGVRLISIAERTYLELQQTGRSSTFKPFYVIGSEVPPAGGKKHEEKVRVTTVDDIRDTLLAYKNEFEKRGLSYIWSRVAALVIQPGVEFGNETVDEFSVIGFGNTALALKGTDVDFEAHSTDYQTRDSLKKLVDNRFAILKVGPAITKSLTEALFKLEQIELEMLSDDAEGASNFKETLISVMRESPKNWRNYYSGYADIELQHSLLDRSRYYLGNQKVNTSIQKLFRNLDASIPIAPAGLIRYYFPEQFRRINWRTSSAFDILVDYVSCQVEDYDYAISL